MTDNSIPDQPRPSDALPPDCAPSATPSSPDAAEREALEARYRHALAEVDRLSRPQDFGSADRTSREAGRAMWLAEAARLGSLLGFEAIEDEA